MISNFYTTDFSTNREKLDGTAFEENLTGQKCHIQQEGGEPIELDSGAFGTEYNMWCAVIDIQVGDQVVIDSTIYPVKEVKIFDIGNNPHLEILLVLPI